MGPPGRHDNSCRLPARPTGFRAGRPPLGSGGLQNGDPARPQGQEGHSQHPSNPRRRTAGAAAAPARTGAPVALRVHLGAGSAVHDGGVCPHGRTCRLRSEARVQSPPAHAQARVRFCAGEQGARYASAASVPWTPQHSAHSAIHGVVADEVQGFLARVKRLGRATNPRPTTGRQGHSGGCQGLRCRHRHRAADCTGNARAPWLTLDDFRHGSCALRGRYSRSAEPRVRGRHCEVTDRRLSSTVNPRVRGRHTTHRHSNCWFSGEPPPTGKTLSGTSRTGGTMNPRVRGRHVSVVAPCWAVMGEPPRTGRHIPVRSSSCMR